MQQEKINFREVRDFSQVYSASFVFLRQNFKLFFGCLLFIAGPFILLSSASAAFYTASSISDLGSFASSNPFARFGISYFVYLFTTALASIAMIGTVYSFMLVYQEKGPGNFTVSDVARFLSRKAGWMIGAFLTAFFILFIIIIVIVGIVIGVGTAVPVAGVLLGLALIVGMLILVPPLLWQISAMYLAGLSEPLGIFEAYGKTRIVMRDNFWWTWLLLFVSLLMVGFMQGIFAIPQVVYQLALTYSAVSSGDFNVSIPFIIVSLICTFLSTLVGSLLPLINGFHYFSLTEKHDGKGLMDRISEIGKTNTGNDIEQQY
jgi:hypothetical protein